MAAVLALTASCRTSTQPPQPVRAEVLSGDAVPWLSDDLDFANLILALNRQQDAFNRYQQWVEIEIAGLRIDESWVETSLQRFRELVAEAVACREQPPAQSNDTCLARFNSTVASEFHIIKVPNPVYTGYYTPHLEVSKYREGDYQYPIYGVPAPADRFHSRDAIDFEQVLAGKGYELFYAASRFDLYVLHIEGGGRLTVHDNGQTYTRYLHYSVDNGQPFRRLAEYMLEHDLLGPNNQSRHDQRSYLEAHPEQARAIYASCPGYVFFTVSEISAVGSNGEPLTAGRSMATDPVHYPLKGLVAYVRTRLPEFPPPGVPLDSNPANPDYRTMGRFFVDQDIGNLLYGEGRADLFFGDGPQAEYLSNNVSGSGELYFLLLK